MLKIRIVASAVLAILLVLIGYLFVPSSAKPLPQIESGAEISGLKYQNVISDDQIASITATALAPAQGYLARVFLNSPEDVESALLRAEELYRKGEVSDADEPLAFVLHGPEVQIFFKDNYQQYRSIVDLAAKLSAFRIIDIKVCKTRLGVLGRSDEVLPPFIGTVPFGPVEVERLLVEEQYVYF